MRFDVSRVALIAFFEAFIYPGRVWHKNFWDHVCGLILHMKSSNYRKLLKSQLACYFL